MTGSGRLVGLVFREMFAMSNLCASAAERRKSLALRFSSGSVEVLKEALHAWNVDGSSDDKLYRQS